MILFVTTLHILLCVLLILVILFQPGKGGDVSSAFGAGASSSVFGPRGVAAPLARITTVVAVLFMVTSITLAVHSNRGGDDVEDLEDQIQELEGLQEGEGFVPSAPPEGAAAPELPGLPGLELPAEGTPGAGAPAGELPPAPEPTPAGEAAPAPEAPAAPAP